MSDDISERTEAHFSRANPGAVHRRLCRGDVRSGRNVELHVGTAGCCRLGTVEPCTTSPKRQPVMTDHRRVARRFIPPFLQYMPRGIADVQWVDRQLPEVISIGLLYARFGLGAGAECALATARALRQIRPEGHAVRASDYGGSSAREATQVSEARDRAIAEATIAEGLNPAVVDKLAGFLPDHVTRCRRALELGTAT